MSTILAAVRSALMAISPVAGGPKVVSPGSTSARRGNILLVVRVGRSVRVRIVVPAWLVAAAWALLVSGCGDREFSNSTARLEAATDSQAEPWVQIEENAARRRETQATLEQIGFRIAEAPPAQRGAALYLMDQSLRDRTPIDTRATQRAEFKRSLARSATMAEDLLRFRELGLSEVDAHNWAIVLAAVEFPTPAEPVADLPRTAESLRMSELDARAEVFRQRYAAASEPDELQARRTTIFRLRASLQQQSVLTKSVDQALMNNALAPEVSTEVREVISRLKDVERESLSRVRVQAELARSAVRLGRIDPAAGRLTQAARSSVTGALSRGFRSLFRSRPGR